MKKILFIVAGLLFITAATFAQDTTRVQKSPEQTQNYTQDMIKIKSTDVPEAVKLTLQAPQYQGWETAPLYRSKNNDMYIVEFKNATETKTFRFGADGKPILE